jgi:hypothetical protein
MRLIDCRDRTKLCLVDFVSENVPQYAILSHTWGKVNEEVTLTDVMRDESKYKAGYEKIRFCAQQAARDGIHYIWVDTCCIDKTSSAELSEAINSMFYWYQKANVCYAYMSDVGEESMPTDFTSSKWFTRGWTLQELLAPQQVKFFGKRWGMLGTRTTLVDKISSATRIDSDTLSTPELYQTASIARRMSWAAGRITTRIEDVAYSLLGIFGVNMPLLYGEGNRAFIRLQEEIMKGSDDHSLFAWESAKSSTSSIGVRGVFASSPAEFKNSGQIIPFPEEGEISTYSMTNKGLQIQLPIQEPSSGQGSIAVLNCHNENDFLSCIGIPLIETATPQMFLRGEALAVVPVPSDPSRIGKRITIFIRKAPDLGNQVHLYQVCWIRSETLSTYKYVLTRSACFPSTEMSCNLMTNTLRWRLPTGSQVNSEWQHFAFLFQNNERRRQFIIVLSKKNDANQAFLGVFRQDIWQPLHQWLGTYSDNFESEHFQSVVHDSSEATQLILSDGDDAETRRSLVINAILREDKIFGQKLSIIEVTMESRGQIEHLSRETFTHESTWSESDSESDKGKA